MVVDASIAGCNGFPGSYIPLPDSKRSAKKIRGQRGSGQQQAGILGWGSHAARRTVGGIGTRDLRLNLKTLPRPTLQRALPYAAYALSAHNLEASKTRCRPSAWLARLRGQGAPRIY